MCERRLTTPSSATPGLRESAQASLLLLVVRLPCGVVLSPQQRQKALAKLLLGVIPIFHFQRELSKYCFYVFRVHSDLVSMKMREESPNY